MTQFANMTLNDLKTGMIVTMRDGHECVVLRRVHTQLCKDIDVFVDIKSRSWFEMNSFDNDFKCWRVPTGDYDIVKIEQPRHIFDSMNLSKDIDKREILWKETTTIKLTVAEIENRLGYRIEIVSDKNGEE